MTFVDHADFGDLLALAGGIAKGDGETWERFIHGLPPPVRRRIAEEWFWQAHGGQAEPEGAWRVWLLMAGRGFGKTRAGAEWISARARERPGARIALVGANRHEIAKVMIEGPSGLLAVARTREAPMWTPTRGVVRFSSGAEAFVYSAAAPDQLRGAEHEFAWADELAKWRHADATWDNLQMTMRVGERPRMVVTTTPRRVAILRRVRALKGTVETRGRTEENAHLSDEARGWLAETYGGTRLGRQELDGVLFDEPEGALWSRDALDRHRAPPACRFDPADRTRWRRIVVGVDPPASAEGNACGIVVCGLGEGDVAYVLDDRTVSGLRPEGWARAVARAAEDWGADRVIAERNQGGDMVESVLRSADAALPVTLVSASRGKAARAEPVATRFENGRARLAGRFPALEAEMEGLTIAGGYEPEACPGPDGPGRSPDRADAMVWAMTALMRASSVPKVRQL